MIKKTLTVLIISILCSTTCGWAAINVATGTIRNGAFTDQFTYTIELWLNSDAQDNPGPMDPGDFNLGNATLVVNYNSTALNTPVLSEQNATFHNDGSFYGAMSLDTTISGEVGLVINFLGGAGSQVPRTEFLLAKITFTIGNPAQTAMISANGSPAKTDMDDAAGVEVFLSWTGTDNRNLTCAPDIEGTPGASADIGGTYQFIPVPKDMCGAATYTIANQPGWASFDDATGELSGNPTAADFGAFDNIEITVTDNGGTDVIGPFTIDVVCPTALSISGTPVTSIVAGNAYDFTPAVTGACGTVTFGIQNMPAWAAFDTGTGALTGNPALADVGTTSGIVISAEDQVLNSDALTAFDLEVTPNCTAPMISGSPDLTIDAGGAYAFTPTVSNGCGTLNFTIQNMPAWASFNAQTGVLTGNPDDMDVGTYTGIAITVTDMFNESSTLTAFGITVNALPAPSGGGGGGGGGGGCFISILGQK